MADKANTSQGAGAAPTADSPAAIRNVVLVGPSGGGKTTLVEALLAATGVLTRPGSVVDGTTVCDFDDAEISQQRSVGLALAPLSHDGVKVNLIDTPGYADFVGELRAGLRAADCALFVIAANEGVDELTKSLWQECQQVGMPRAVVITKLDHARANYDNALAAAQTGVRRQGAAAVPARQLAVHRPDRPAVADALRVLRRQAHHPDPDSSYADRIDEQRGTLIEGIIEESEDETLMERYLGGEEIDEKVLIDDLEKAVARGSFFPVIPVCSGTGVGTLELLEVATSGFPSPLEHPLPEVFTPQGKDRATAWPATRTDRCWPRWSRRRRTPTSAGSAWSGCSPAPSGPTRRCTCRAIFRPSSVRAHGRHARPATPTTTRTSASARCRSRSASSSGRRRTVVAGDICAIGRLTRAETGDTLSDKADPLVLKPWTMPEPLLPIAVQPHAKTDEDKLSVGLQRLAAEDPTLRIEQNPETHQIVLWCMGEAHAGVVLDGAGQPVRRQRRHRRAARAAAGDVRRQGEGPRPPRQAVRRARPVRGLRHRGGAAAGGLRLRVRRQGGRRLGAAAVHPERREGRARADGEGRRHAGYPVVDIRVTLLDGKAHSVDSSDFAFQMAGGLALREAAAATRVNLLEPVDEVSVLVPDDLVGAVMGDLSSRRGRVLGTDNVGEDRTVVKAEVPQVELTRYAIDLRSLSHGAGVVHPHASPATSRCRSQPRPR